MGRGPLVSGWVGGSPGGQDNAGGWEGAGSRAQDPRGKIPKVRKLSGITQLKAGLWGGWLRKQGEEVP